MRSIYLLLLCLIHTIAFAGKEIKTDPYYTTQTLFDEYVMNMNIAGNINVCPKNHIAPDRYEANKKLICDGLPCDKSDFDCIRRERGKKYDEFCSEMVNQEYLKSMEEHETAVDSALNKAIELNRISFLDEALRILDQPGGVNAFFEGKPGQDYKNIYDQLADTKRNLELFDYVANSENARVFFSPDDIETAKKCVKRVSANSHFLKNISMFFDICKIKSPSDVPDKFTPSEYSLTTFAQECRKAEIRIGFNDQETNKFQINAREICKNLKEQWKNAETDRRKAVEEGNAIKREVARREEEQCIKDNIEISLCTHPRINGDKSISRCRDVKQIDSQQCAGMIFEMNYRINKFLSKFEINEMTIDSMKGCKHPPDVCRFMAKTGRYNTDKCTTPETCRFLLQEEKTQATNIKSIYSDSRMRKVEKQLDDFKLGYASLFFEWKEEGRIDDDEFKRLKSRLDNITIKPSQDAYHAEDVTGRCTCHYDTSENPKDICTHSEISIGPEFMSIIDTPDGKIELNSMLAHEIGHALAPEPMDKERGFPIFDDDYECLKKSLNVEGYKTKSFKEPAFRAEALADFLSVEVMSHTEGGSCLYCSKEDLLKSKIALVCNVLDYNYFQGNECYQNANGKYLYPKEVPSCKDLGVAHQIPQDRLATIIENKNFRETFDCPMDHNKNIFPASCPAEVKKGSKYDN